MRKTITAGDLALKRPLLKVSAKAAVSEVMQSMAKNKVTAACVMRRGRIIGVFTMKDVMTRVLGYKTTSIWRQPKRRKIRDVAVRVLMSPNPYTVDANADIRRVMDVMREHRIRHLPVMRDGSLIGIVTLRDVIDALRSIDTGKPVRKKLATMYLENPYADLVPARARQ